MKRPYQIFKHRPELQDDPEVNELIREYDQVCDQLIELEQKHEASKEDLLKILVREIQESISHQLQRDHENERFKLNDPVDFKQGALDLQHHIHEYLRDNRLWL